MRTNLCFLAETQFASSCIPKKVGSALKGAGISHCFTFSGVHWSPQPGCPSRHSEILVTGALPRRNHHQLRLAGEVPFGLLCQVFRKTARLPLYNRVRKTNTSVKNGPWSVCTGVSPCMIMLALQGMLLLSSGRIASFPRTSGTFFHLGLWRPVHQVW